MLDVLHLGRTKYAECWSYQQELLERRSAGEIPDTLVLTEHDHVYTVGANGVPSHILASAAELDALGATVISTDRGGDVTYHGPGQLVAYPILDLERHRKDLHWYLRALEETIIRLLARYGVEAARCEPYTGVWVGQEKLCAIGVRTSRWVTMHGLALNVNTDLRYFAAIIPCGITHRGVSSLARLLDSSVDMTELSRAFVVEFAEVFHLVPRYQPVPKLPMGRAERPEDVGPITGVPVQETAS
jgi:lipoyl(octanoyl) transferase